MTFVNITNCHADLIKLEDPNTPNHPDRKVRAPACSLFLLLVPGDGTAPFY